MTSIWDISVNAIYYLTHYLATIDASFKMTLPLLPWMNICVKTNMYIVMSPTFLSRLTRLKSNIRSATITTPGSTALKYYKSDLFPSPLLILWRGLTDVGTLAIFTRRVQRKQFWLKAVQLSESIARALKIIDMLHKKLNISLNCSLRAN